MRVRLRLTPRTVFRVTVGGTSLMSKVARGLSSSSGAREWERGGLLEG